MSNDPEPEGQIFRVDMDNSIHKRFVLDPESGALRELTDGELPHFGLEERAEKLEDGLIASIGPLTLSDSGELSAILEEVRMIRRALEKTPLFIVVPVSGDVDVQAVADALNVLHAEVTAHMHQEAANETRPGSELPE